jgi:hypothetical protein
MSALKIIAVPARGSSGAGTAVVSGLDVSAAIGKTGVAIMASPGGAFVGTAKLESSDDGATWVDAVAGQAMTGPGTYVMPIVGAKQYRVNVTAYTSGSISGTLIFS